MGVASTGVPIGNIVLPFFTSWCIDVYNWRGAFILLGGLCLQGVIAGLVFYSGDKIHTSDDGIGKQAGMYLVFIETIITGNHDTEHSYACRMIPSTSLIN